MRKKWTQISRAVSNNEITQLQQSLQALGFFGGPPNGIIDARTEDAVRAFQLKYLPMKNVKKRRQFFSTFLGNSQIDRDTADAIRKQHSQAHAREIFGIPNLQVSQVEHLRAIGISDLSDLPMFDTSLLYESSDLNDTLLLQLHRIGNISKESGLSPRIAYILVEVGGITNIDELRASTESEVSEIFKTAENNGLVHAGDAGQIEALLETLKHSNLEINTDLRRVFPSLEETEASKLSKAGISWGSQLRNINVRDISEKTDISQERLQRLKHAAELVQIRGITAEIALALTDTEIVKGIREFSNLTPEMFEDRLSASLKDHVIDIEIFNLLQKQKSLVLNAVASIDCQSNICSERSYLDYLIKQYMMDSGDTDMSDAVDRLNLRFMQQYDLPEDENSQVPLITIVIDILEKLNFQNIRAKFFEDMNLSIPDKASNETYRSWFNRILSQFPQDHILFHSMTPDSSWHLANLPVPDTLVGTRYIHNLIDLYCSILHIDISTPAKRTHVINGLSETYGINLLCNQTDKTTRLGQAILTLQNYLYSYDIPFTKYGEWCGEKQRKHHPENFYDLRPFLRFFQDQFNRNNWLTVGKFEEIPWILQQIDDLHHPDQVKELEIAKERLNKIQTIINGEDLYIQGLSELTKLNPLGALNFFARSMQEFKLSLRDPNRQSLASQIHGGFDPEIDDLLNWENRVFFRTILTRMKNRWGINHPEDQAIMLDEHGGHTGRFLKSLISVYEHYSAYDPNGITTQEFMDEETGEVTSWDEQNSLEKLEQMLGKAFHFQGIWFYLKHKYPDSTFIHLDKWIAYSYNNAMSSVIHYMMFVLPLNIGNALSQIGAYTQAAKVYGWIYDFESERKLYPYLNVFVELPLLRKRFGANLLDWADSLLKRNTFEDVLHAKHVYERLLQLHDNCVSSDNDQLSSIADSVKEMTASLFNYNKLTEELSRNQRFQAISQLQQNLAAAIPLKYPIELDAPPCLSICNPVILSQVQKARMRLSLIKRRLNILGYSDDIAPVLRFSYLINQAKYFVALAITAEKDFIQFISNAERESFDQLTARQVLSSATANVQIEIARANIEQKQIEIATLQRSQLNQELINLQTEIDEARDPIFEKAEFAQASDEYANQVSIFGWNVGAINQPLGGAFGTLRGGVDSLISSIWGGTPQIDVRRRAAAKARENRINAMNRQKDLMQNYGLPIADAQIDLAIAKHELAQRQIAIAQLQEQHAQEIVTFLQSKFLNMELWYELAQEMRIIYRNLLDYAVTMAFLAERTLEFELNQQFNSIRFDYYEPKKQGLLGAEKLQQDIAGLEYQKTLLTEQKKNPVKVIISLTEEYPLEFLRFTQTGKTYFATEFRQFDHLFPGAYQSRISRIEIILEGLVPPEGIRGTLSSSGVSYVRTEENEIKTIVGNPETMVLSSYTIRGDQAVFHKSDHELELFEGLGTVTDWTLEIPKDANNINYQTITDIKLVVYYTAFWDDLLREYLILRRPKDGDAYLTFSARFHFPDAFYSLVNNIEKLNSKYQAELTLETNDYLFPPNQQFRRVANLNIALLLDDEAPKEMPFQLSSRKRKEIGNNEITVTDKLVAKSESKHLSASSNIGAVDEHGNIKAQKPLNEFGGIDMQREWKLQLTLDPKAHKELFSTNHKDEEIPDLSKVVDVLFTIEYQYDRTDLIMAEQFITKDNWDTIHNWEIVDGTYRGAGRSGQQRISIRKIDDDIQSFMVDNTMIAFRSKVSDEDDHTNDIRFYFADGSYLLIFDRNPGSTRLIKVGTKYQPYPEIVLGETQNEQFLIKPNRWYKVEVFKFGARIEVVLDGATVFDVTVNDPVEGAGIAVGTLGDGYVYFDYILI